MTQRGMTLLELIIVLMVIGVMAAAAANKLQSPGNQTLANQAELFASDLRHTQSLAMAWAVPLLINITATGYSVQCVTASTTAPCNKTPVIDPATSSAYSVTLQNGVTLSGTGFAFDTMGRPIDSATSTLLTTAKTYTLSATNLNWQVSAAPLTGFVSNTRL